MYTIYWIETGHIINNIIRHIYIQSYLQMSKDDIDGQCHHLFDFSRRHDEILYYLMKRGRQGWYYTVIAIKTSLLGRKRDAVGWV